ncbi:MAG: VWA domain-containing protein [Planctomycetota bacterium]
MTLDPRIRRELQRRVATLQQQLVEPLSGPLADAMKACDENAPAAVAPAWQLLERAATAITLQMATVRQMAVPRGAGVLELARLLAQAQMLEHRFAVMLRRVANPPDGATPDELGSLFVTLVELYEWHVERHVLDTEHDLALVGGTSIRNRPEMDMTGLDDLIRRLNELDARYAEWEPKGDAAPIRESAGLLHDIADIVKRIENSAFRERLADRVRVQKAHHAILENWFQRLVHRLATRSFRLAGDPSSAPIALGECLRDVRDALEAAPVPCQPLGEYVDPLTVALTMRLRERVGEAQRAQETAPGYGVLAGVEAEFERLAPLTAGLAEPEALRDEGFKHSRRTLDGWIARHQARLRNAAPGLADMPNLLPQQNELRQIHQAVAGTMRERSLNELDAGADAAIRQRVDSARAAIDAADPGVKGFGGLIRVWRDAGPALEAAAGCASPHQAALGNVQQLSEQGITQRLGDVKHAIDEVPADLDGVVSLAELHADVGHLARQGAGTPFAREALGLQHAVEGGLQARVDKVMKQPLPPLGRAMRELGDLQSRLDNVMERLPQTSPIREVLSPPHERAHTAMKVVEKAGPVLKAGEEARIALQAVLPEAARPGQESQALIAHEDLVGALKDAYLGPIPSKDIAPAEREINTIATDRDTLRQALESASNSVAGHLDYLAAAPLPALGDEQFRDKLRDLRDPLEALAREGMKAHAAASDASAALKVLDARAKSALDSALSVALKRNSAVGLHGRTDAGKLLAARQKLIDSIERRPVYANSIWRLAENWAAPPLPDDVPAPATAEVTGLTLQAGFSRKGGLASMTVVLLDKQAQPYRGRMRPENISLRCLEIGADGEPAITIDPGHARVLDVDNSEALHGGPIVCALMMDCSGSLNRTDPDGSRIDAAKDLISTLLKQQRVQVGLYSFSGRKCTKETPFGRDTLALHSALEAMREKARSKTPLWMAVNEVCADLSATPSDARRVIVIFTDGRNDTTDETTPAAAIDVAQRVKARVFTVGLGRKFDSPELNKLCGLTRGTFARSSGGGLKQLFAAIARAVLASISLTVELPLTVRPDGQGLSGRTMDVNGELVVHLRPGEIVPSPFRVQTGY